MPAPTGADTSVHYQIETAFKDGGGGTNRVFGANETLETAEATNNGTRIYMPGSNRAVDIKEGTFDGAWSVSFGLTNPWWLEAVFGAPNTVDNADGTYTHTFNGDPASIAIKAGDETTGSTRTLNGCVVSSASIDPTVDENTGPVTLEGFYVEESEGGAVTSQQGLSFDAYDYADASLSLGGTAEAIVQNASLSIEAATEPINEFGTRFGTDYLVGAFEPTISYAKIKQDETSLNDVYGGSTSVQENVDNLQALTLSFAKGGDTIDFNCEASFPESYSASYGDVTSAIEEELNRFITDVTVDATNSTATAP